MSALVAEHTYQRRPGVPCLVFSHYQCLEFLLGFVAFPDKTAQIFAQIFYCWYLVYGEFLDNFLGMDSSLFIYLTCNYLVVMSEVELGHILTNITTVQFTLHSRSHL